MPTDFDAVLEEARRREAVTTPPAPVATTELATQDPTTPPGDVNFTDVLEEARRRESESAGGPGGTPEPTLDPETTPPAINNADLTTDELDLSLRQAAAANPTAEAENRRLAKGLDIPQELLPSDASEQLFRKENNAETLQKESPAVANFMFDKNNAAIVGPGVRELTTIEKLHRRLMVDPTITALKGIALAAEDATGVGAIAQTLVNPALRPLVDPLIRKARGAFEGLVDFDAVQAALDERLTPEQRRANAQLNEAEGFIGTLGAAIESPSTIPHLVIQSGGGLAVSGVVARQLLRHFPKLGPLVAGAIGEGSFIAAGTAEGIRKETEGGVITGGQAGLSVAAGAVGIASNLLGGRISQKLGVADVDTAIASGTLKQALDISKMPPRLAKRVLAGGVLEGFEEMPQSAAEQIANNVGLGKPWDQGVPEAMAQGLIAGVAMGAGFGAATTPPSKEVLNRAIDNAAAKEVANMTRAQQAADTKGSLEGYGKAVAESELRSNDPEAFKEFVRTMAEEEGNLKEVYVDAAQLNESLAQSGMTPEELEQKMPDLAKELKIAQDIQGEVRISIEDYATYIAGSKAEVTLLDHLRTSPEGMTFGESQKYFQEQEKSLTEQAQQLVTENTPVLTRAEFQEQDPEGDYNQFLKDHENKVEAFAADTKEVHDTILTGLNETGRFTKAVNASYAIPFQQFFAVNAARQGVMPSELFKTLPLNFRSMTIGGSTLTQAPATSKQVSEFAKGLEKELGLKTLFLFLDGKGSIKLESIIVDKADRKKGVGTAALKRITEYADQQNLRITLTPAVKDDFQGTTSKARLIKFYKRFGFVENKGRNKDFEISGTMYRDAEQAPADPNILKQFAGPGAVTANQFNLERATELEATGMDNEDIRQLTGWFKGIDDKWRFEIDDSEARLNPDLAARGHTWGEIISKTLTAGEGTALGNVVHHPKLFAAYPQIADINIGRIRGARGAEFTAGKGSEPASIRVGELVSGDDILSFIMHEVQHGLQNIEGFARGGSAELITQLKQDQITELTELTKDPEVLGVLQELDRARMKLEVKPISEAEFLQQLDEAEKELSKDVPAFQDYKEILATMDFLNLEQDAVEGYRRLAGEIEARNVQERLGMTPGTREILAPESTQDLPAADAIVLFRHPQVKNLPTADNISDPKVKGLPAPDNVVPADPNILAQSTFFSALEREIGGLKKVANKKGEVKPDQAIAWINARQKEGKFTKSEVEAVGVLDWLSSRTDPVEVAGVASFIQLNGVRVDEVTLTEDAAEVDTDTAEALRESAEVSQYADEGPDPDELGEPIEWTVRFGGEIITLDRDPFDMADAELLEFIGLDAETGTGTTKFEQYTLEGGENYKELLLTLPGERKFVNDSHFDEENILAHIRFNERQVETAPTAEQLKEQAEYEAALPAIVELEEQSRKALVQSVDERRTLREKLSAEVEAEGTFLRREIESEVEDRLDKLPPTPGTRLRKELNDKIRELPAKPDHLIFGTAKENVLFIEEIQSDWAQAGRKQGFRVSDAREAEIRARIKEIEDRTLELRHAQTPGALALGHHLPVEASELRQEWVDLQNELQPERLTVKPKGAPFVKETKDWTALAMKRMMRYAAEEGFDRIAWTTGAQQADRYDLSKQVSDISASKNNKGTYSIQVTGNDGNIVLDKKVTESELTDTVGKELAEKIVNNADVQNSIVTSFTGLDLKVGGEGMITFYDKIVPQVTNSLLKKLKGPKVEVSDMGEGADLDKVGDQLSFEITPELRATILQGLPLFQKERASYNPATFTISLLEGSDLSSTIHEGGHFYLEALADMAGRPDAPEQIKADFEKSMAWFGIEDPNSWRTMTLEQKRGHHEQWAQSFERYALEGKAPTTEMQPVFARFRTFMLSVYKDLKAFLEQNPLAGKLNDEIRSVFDRLLAAEEGIRDTEKAREYAPLFATAEEAGTTQQAFQEYLEEGSTATAKAVDDLSSRSLRDMRWLSNAKGKIIRQLQAEAKDKREAIRAEVINEVMMEPVNQARTFLRKGILANEDGTVNEAQETFKLNTNDIKSLKPDADLKKLRGMTSKDGVHPDLAAQMFGFSSGDALLTELMDGEKPKDKIDGLTDARMLEEHGDLIDNRAVERAAEKAIHNEARARFMATGLKMLTKSSISAPQLNRAAKQAAESAIAAKKVREITPGQYARAEARANKEAVAKAAKDPNAAIRAQRAALLNNRLVKASTEAQAEVDRILKFLRKFDSNNVRKKLDIEYVEQIMDLLGSFDLRRGVTKKALDKRKSLADWLDEQQANGFEPAIDPSLMDELKTKHFKDMTLEELRGLAEGVKQIEHIGRLKKKLLTAKDKREFAVRVDEADTSIRANANRTVKERGTPTDVVGVTARWFRRMAAEHRKMNSIIREMDGGKDNGVMWNLFSRGMNEAGDLETDMKQTAATDIAALFEGLPKDETIPGNLYARKMLVPGTNMSMTHEQRVMFALNWGNLGNRQRILDGGITGKRALSTADAEKVLDTLSKADWDFVQGTWDYIGGFKEQVSALEKQLTGLEPEWVEASPVVTKFGTFKGGYFPAKYDAELSTRSESLEAVTDLRMGMKGAFGSSATRSGYVQARADQVINRPLLLSYNVISQHISEVTHRLAWQPWLVDANRLLKALDEPIRTHYGPEILTEMRNTVEDIAQGDAPAKNATELAINRLRVGSTIVGMGWRFSTALLQPSGLSQSMSRIGTGWVARGMGEFVANPLAAGRKVNEKSKLMRDRSITMNREINEVLNRIRAGEKVSTLTASYFTMIGKMQRTVDIPTWIGAHEKALKELKFENAINEHQRQAIDDKAVALADQAVIDSQSGGQLKDLARVQRGSPVWKLFTNFYSYFSAAYNLNVEAVRRTNFRSPSEVGLLAIDMLLINVVPVIFSVVLKEMLRPKCEEDLECYAEKLAQEQIGHIMGQMVLLREAGAAVSVATGGDGYGYQGPAGLRFFGDLYKAGTQVSQGEADFAAFKAVNSVGGALLHYPAGQVNATLEGIMAIESGEVEGAGILPALLAGPPK